MRHKSIAGRVGRITGQNRANAGVQKRNALEKMEPDFTTPPFTDAERAEEKIYEKALEKDDIISVVRTRTGDKK